MSKLLRLVITITAFAFAFSLAKAKSDAPSPVTVRYDDSSGLSSHLVGGGIQDPRGLLWFATWNGLNCYDGYDFHWLKIRPGDGASIASDHIRDILLSADGKEIFCRTDNDIFSFSLATYSFSDVPREKKDSLAPLMGQNWLGLTDRQGNRWHADKIGLYKTFNAHHPASVISGTNDLHPRSFLRNTDGNYFIGFREDHTLRTYSPEWELLETRSLPGAPYALCQTRKGDIWVGCKPGALMRLGEEPISDDDIYDIKEDSRGRLWVATFGHGVKCVPDPSADSPTLSPSLGGRKVRQLLITPSENLVAATTDGLLVGSIDNDDWHSIKLRAVHRDGSNPESLANDATMALAQDSSGNIYIATESSGVDVITESSLMSDRPVFKHLDRGGSTLTTDICRAMTLDSDTLLVIVGSSNVMAFNPQTGQTVNFAETFWNDTCRFAETTPIRLPDGSWLFGATEGAFVATPHNLYSRGYVPPIVFTTLAVNGEPGVFSLPPRDTLNLAPSQRDATIGFAAIDFGNNSGILYRTRLDGSPWTAASRDRSATLYNLTPGEHLLEAQSTDRYGRWVDNTHQLSVIVAPYWYETWWATLMFFLLAIGAAGAIVYTVIYIRRLNRQRRELLEKYMALMRQNVPAPAEKSEEPTTETPVNTSEETPLLRRVRRYIEENIANPDANVDDMALAAAASRSTLNRHLRSQLGVSAARLLSEARMRRAEQLLDADPTLTPADVAPLVGYSDPQYFQRVFNARREG